MPLQATSGTASYDAFGGGVAAVPNYIEDVFSTWLYTGNGSTQTITNGIDLSTYGGLIWIRYRDAAAGHRLVDTARGVGKKLETQSTLAEGTESTGVTAFNTTGFSVGSAAAYNGSAGLFVNWTFRKQPKFFDVVTYTGNGANRTIAHSLGSTPGCIFVKRTDSIGDWYVYHSGYGGTGYYLLNSTAGASSDSTIWNDTNPTSTVFSVGTGNTNVNGGTYVAYLFAHNAGGFGLTGTDNVISCGTFSTNASGVRVQSLGYEPQWILIKRASGGTGNWYMFDTMRGWSMSNDALLNADLSDAESSSLSYGNPTATGFETANLNGSTTFIYIAIRRGPMKVPTSGTSVFTPLNSYVSSSGQVETGVVNGDLFISSSKTGSDMRWGDRLRGFSSNSGVTIPIIASQATAAEFAHGPLIYDVWNNNFKWGPSYPGLGVGYRMLHMFRRAPGFFDEVCYTGNGTVGNQISHNLTVAPQMIFVKSRSQGDNWSVYSATNGASGKTGLSLNLNSQANNNASYSSFTSTYFVASSILSDSGISIANKTGVTYVAYLFATCAGVSKVGSYTGNGSSQTINCGFTGGARYVLIKRTDSTGDWYVWDTARGIVAGNDPYLTLNTYASEVTTDDTIDTDSTGFIVNQVAATNVNVTSATYIFLAIA